MTLVVCGLPGSNSEQAGKLYAQQAGLEVSLRYCANGVAVVESMRLGDIGVIPIENSTAGPVDERNAIPQSARLITTVALPIRHQLLVTPGMPFEQIRRVVSHEQALAQCGKFLAAELPSADRVPYPDTAQAAKDLADGRLEAHDVVIASRSAAERYGLEILRSDIQDSAENATTFQVFSLTEA